MVIPTPARRAHPPPQGATTIGGEGWGHEGTPQRPNSRVTPQGLDQRSKMEVVPSFTNVLPPHCGGAVPAPFPTAGQKWETTFPRGLTIRSPPIVFQQSQKCFCYDVIVTLTSFSVIIKCSHILNFNMLRLFPVRSFDSGTMSTTTVQSSAGMSPRPRVVDHLSQSSYVSLERRISS